MAPADAGDAPETVYQLLCRQQAPEFQRAAKSGEELLIGCTQEQRLFLELAEQTEGARPLAERPIRFVNLRESGGWSAQARAQPAALVPKLAALIKAAQRPEAEPVPSVSYRSGGRCLVIGSATHAQAAAMLLADRLDVSLLITETGVVGHDELPQARTLPVAEGRITQLSGWLGAFDVEWQSANPIDLDLCTRCNAKKRRSEHDDATFA